jgi:hypothetical protein
MAACGSTSLLREGGESPPSRTETRRGESSRGRPSTVGCFGRNLLPQWSRRTKLAASRRPESDVGCRLTIKAAQDVGLSTQTRAHAPAESVHLDLTRNLRERGAAGRCDWPAYAAGSGRSRRLGVSLSKEGRSRAFPRPEGEDE